MKRTAHTVPLIFLLPLFFILQTFLVPHLHTDERGETHAHTHIVAENTHRENLAADESPLSPYESHKHSHEELHRSSSQLFYVKSPTQLKLAPLTQKILRNGLELGGEVKRLFYKPLDYELALVSRFAEASEKGWIQALQNHMTRIRSVRLTT